MTDHNRQPDGEPRPPTRQMRRAAERRSPASGRRQGMVSDITFNRNQRRRMEALMRRKKGK